MGRDFETFQAMMRELYRICRPGALVRIVAKHPWSNLYIHDPTVVRVISPQVLDLFDRQPGRFTPDSVARQLGVDFEFVKRQVNLAEPYLSQFKNGQLTEDEVFRMGDSLLNVCSNYELELKVHKPPRAPAAQPQTA
jgi:hypothetical protein